MKMTVIEDTHSFLIQIEDGQCWEFSFTEFNLSDLEYFLKEIGNEVIHKDIV